MVARGNPSAMCLRAKLGLMQMPKSLPVFSGAFLKRRHHHALNRSRQHCAANHDHMWLTLASQAGADSLHTRHVTEIEAAICIARRANADQGDL